MVQLFYHHHSIHNPWNLENRNVLAEPFGGSCLYIKAIVFARPAWEPGRWDRLSGSSALLWPARNIRWKRSNILLFAISEASGELSRGSERTKTQMQDLVALLLLRWELNRKQSQNLTVWKQDKETFSLPSRVLSKAMVSRLPGHWSALSAQCQEEGSQAECQHVMREIPHTFVSYPVKGQLQGLTWPYGEVGMCTRQNTLKEREVRLPMTWVWQSLRSASFRKQKYQPSTKGLQSNTWEKLHTGLFRLIFLFLFFPVSRL